MDQISSRERTVRWPTWKRDKEASPYEWRPHGGETLQEKQRSSHTALHELSELFVGKRGVIVAHGETNLVIQASIEHIIPGEFKAREPELRMDNTDIIQYKRHGITGLYKRRISPTRNERSMWQRIR
jgi:broad specificity phosphatase PhoE